MVVLWPNGSTSIPRVSSEFGMRTHPVTGRPSTFHYGIDLVGWAIVKSPVDGVVTFAGYNGGAGNEVRIKARNGDVFRLLHNRSFLIRQGQSVRQGQDVAVMGTTGSSTGVHCHEETRPGGGAAINPRDYYARANAGTSGGGTNPKPKPPTPKPKDPNTEEEEEMAGNSGFYYKKATPANTIVYLIVNNDESTYHEYSNGNGGGAMPSAYNNAIAAAYRTGSFAPITEGHARVIKAQNSAKPGQETVILDWNDVEFAKFLAALEEDGNAAASAAQVAAAPTVRA